jgi:hypothetical protein
MQTTEVQATAPTIPLSDLSTIDALAAAYPQLLTPATLRWQLRHRETNGLATACVQVGKKLLISRTRYESWLATRAGA